MLIDTSGFLCVYDDSEEHHTKGLSLYDAAQHHLTTNYILTEYVALAHVRGVPDLSRRAPTTDNFTSEGESSKRKGGIREMFGTWSSGNPKSADNEQIDADLAKAYADNHEGED